MRTASRSGNRSAQSPRSSVPNEIIINAEAGETRVAILEQGTFAELHIEREGDRSVTGTVVMGRVTRVLPGMQAAFVDIGLEKAAFLYVGDYLDEFGKLGTGSDAGEAPRRGRRGRNGNGRNPPTVRGSCPSASAPARATPLAAGGARSLSKAQPRSASAPARATPVGCGRSPQPLTASHPGRASAPRYCGGRRARRSASATQRRSDALNVTRRGHQGSYSETTRQCAKCDTRNSKVKPVSTSSDQHRPELAERGKLQNDSILGLCVAPSGTPGSSCKQPGWYHLRFIRQNRPL